MWPRGEGWVFTCLEFRCDRGNCTYGDGGRCGHVARGGCSLAWNYGVTGATVLTEMADTQTGSDKLSLHY